MKDKLSYIDNIAREKLKEFVITPQTNWEILNKKLNNVLAESTFSGILSNIGGFFSSKLFIITVVIISFFTAGIIISEAFSEDVSDNRTFEKNNEFENPKMNSNSFNIASKHANDSLNRAKRIIEMDTATGNITVKIEVPVHKNIVIKKKIVVRDTLNKSDSVKIKY